MKSGIIYPHQGYTDIINSLPLADWYLSHGYDKLLFVASKSAWPIVEYYIKDKPNVKVIDINDLMDMDRTGIDFLYHGFNDSVRGDGDKYTNAFFTQFRNPGKHFVELFYTSYDIPYFARVEYFNLERDLELEDSVYNAFVDMYGLNYSIFHYNPDPNSQTKLTSDNCIVNVNGITENPFAFVKVLQNANEIHLIDSVWASMCYLLDARYGLFQNKTISLYPFSADGRHGGCIYYKGQDRLFPFALENWKICE